MFLEYILDELYGHKFECLLQGDSPTHETLVLDLDHHRSSSQAILRIRTIRKYYSVFKHVDLEC